MFTFKEGLQQRVPGTGPARLLKVMAPEDIESLVKESQVLTGRPGRTFVIAGADWLVYRIHWRPHGLAMGLLIERLGAHGEVLHCQQLQLWEFLDHSLVEAQAAGQLFTPPVRHQR